jgi:UDP-N-acetylmuramyl pentapeptide phosphotransferase/UDP-N-acetylglucosamine-1-phosphate transferase
MIWTYIIIAVLLLAAELVYFRIADKYNIIDKPNERSSHKSIVLRGGGVIFTLSMIAWAVMMTVQGSGLTVMGYLPFIVGLVMISGISFIDDIRSLPDSVRLVVQFISMTLMIYQLIIDNGQLTIENWWGWVLFVLAALIVCVGATNIINFMDGINGITAGYSLAVLVPLLLVDNGQLTILWGSL